MGGHIVKAKRGSAGGMPSTVPCPHPQAGAGGHSMREGKPGNVAGRTGLPGGGCTVLR